MKSVAPINDNQDIITKGYLENEYSPYEVSANPPTNTNKIWINTSNGGIQYYYDPTSVSWKSVRFATDSDEISVSNEEES